MNRFYYSEQIIEACNRLRKAKKDPFIACDIIAGFPGETDEDFVQTLNLCNKCNFIWVHGFPYSERPETKAIELPNKVPQNIAGQRINLLNQLSIKNKIEYLNKFGLYILLFHHS